MPTRTVVLTEYHEQIIERLGKSGRYRNASEVMHEGIHLIEQREAREAARLKTLSEGTHTRFPDRSGDWCDDGIGEV